RELFQAMPGTGHSFLADPVFEATFGWEPASKTLGQLSGTLLHPDLIHALSHPPRKLAEDYVFPQDRKPYRHQWEAWQALIEPTPPRSVLVSSGTGSGKTECFLIPILNDLANEAAAKPGVLTGVRALFLYPLNALIKSQRDRLTAWTERFDGRLRYCLYNGDTPQHSPPNRVREWRCEVAGRDKLRGNPPPILVTNATMLEYLLVRDDDRPILEQSQGRLRWIVIDEAHSYIGSQAAELTLLLRRVLHGFGCRAEDVHFVATSATIAGSDENTRRFLADIAGVDPERVTVVMGRRKVPELSKSLSRLNKPHPGLEKLHGLSPSARYAALAADPRIRELRSRLIEKATRLSDLAQTAWGRDKDSTRSETLELLDLCTQASSEKPESFLPLRGHFFQRAQNGLWACANGECSGRTGTRLDHPGWAFGRVFLERRQHCDACGSPVFELLQCGECGAEYLSAVEVFEQGGEWLKPRLHRQDEDEFQQELEPLDSDEETEGARLKRKRWASRAEGCRVF
ncbi:MAG: DEAD/DEAH box helicase, partial [Burkholderiales bacterium]